MKVCYNNLFKLLIDKKMKKTDLAREAGLTPATLARLSKDEVVSMETIMKICECLDCRIEDVVELVPDNN
ncbi:MAG: helix-turn-helix domain-containing protein [Floccifex porci]|uniref:helix-turn-helix domain-containing protein n=1 Tax=Floccifex porci TaxID=2606629 RepID=UPI003F1193FC